MVLKKSIYYGRFDGFQSTVVPKAPRSLRRSSIRKSSEGGKTCAFDLLAAVADKLLQESESSTSCVTPEQISVNPKDLVKQQVPQVTESTNLKWNLEPPTNKSPPSDDDSGLEHVSDVKTSGFLKKVGNNVKLEPSERENYVDKRGDLCDFNLVNDIAEIQTQSLEKRSRNLTFRDPVESCVNTRVLNKSYSSVHLPYYKDPDSCFTKLGGNVKMGVNRIIDDDENCFRCNQRDTKRRAFRSQSRAAGYRRIRKMLTSRYRKVTSKKDYELPTNSGKYAEAGSKRRKLFHHNSSDTASNNVKLSIKSFQVPELYVEIPETATVGSLKRTVMEAITAFLGGGLHVGILLDGKKVRDNNRTLRQTGISGNCDLETLGFTLEPSFTPPIQKEPPLPLLCDTSLQPSRCEAGPIMDVGFSNSSSLDLVPVATNNENIALQSEVLTEERVADSKAIVKAEALSIVPVNQKPTKSSCEVSQRRIRRPFSVSEVEALVESVETLGTGRWRDVKLRAFDDANHRTYVDLKDKWKTLVHTASISPQQRRGEAVPQDLLDRVLAAHAYWSRWKHQTQPQGSSLEFVGN